VSGNDNQKDHKENDEEASEKGTIEEENHCRS
jgi:hypothetical protein